MEMIFHAIDPIEMTFLFLQDSPDITIESCAGRSGHYFTAIQGAENEVIS